MRRYSDPIEVRRTTGGRAAGSAGGSAGSTAQDLADRPDGSDGAALSAQEQIGEDSPDAFIWHGRLYVVRRVLAHWRERRSWWRDALDPVPGQPTGIDAASREQHVWRVEASRGHAYGVGVFDLTNDGAEGADATWRLVGVAD